MYKILSAIFLFISFYPLYSTEISYSLDSNTVSISISNLYQNTKVSKLPIKQIKTYNNIYSFTTNENDILLDKLLFTIAAPENSSVEAKIVSSDLSFNEKINSFVSNGQSQFLIPNVTLIDDGYLRGVKVTKLIFQPYLVNLKSFEVSTYHDVKIIVRFSKNTHLDGKLSDNFYSSILNKEYVSPLLAENLVSLKKYENKLLFNKIWYDKNKKYVRVITKADGITTVKINNIINIVPDFANLQTKYFHLIAFGKEIPVYFPDNKPNFGSNNLIYFYGSRVKGDTTWYSNYASEYSFFLNYDETHEGLRYQLFPNIINITDTLRKVNYQRHFEVPVKYSVGFNQDSTETVHGEGWRWEILEHAPGPDTKRTLQVNLPFIVSQNSTDSAILSIFLSSYHYDSTGVLFHGVNLSVNNDSISSAYIAGGSDTTISFSSNNFMNGTNTINIESTGIPWKNYTGNDWLGLCYITFRSSGAPFTLIGTNEFTTDTVTKNTTVKLSGFRNNSIIVIDTLNNLISLNKSNLSGTRINAGIKNTGNPYTSITINDSNLIISPNSGLFIGTLKSPDFLQYDIKNYQNYSSDINNYYQSLPDNSIIVFCLNTLNSPDNNLSTFLTSIGSKKINKFKSGNIWLMVVQKNNPSNFDEYLTDKNIFSIDKFYPYQNGNSFSINQDLSGGSNYSISAFDNNSILVASVDSVHTTNLSDISNQADAIVITNKAFLASTKNYVQNRMKYNPDKKFIQVDVDDIYKEFGYGRKDPHAIKDFLTYAYQIWKKPAPLYVTLIGQSSWDPRKIKPNSVNTDYIPTFGWPASDYWYTLLQGDDLNAEMYLGRIPVNTSQQLDDYISKIDDYENSPSNPWMKKFLFISGGQDQKEQANFYDLVKYNLAGDCIKNTAICGDTAIIAKSDFQPGSETDAGKIIKEINSGDFWVSFVGHGSPTIFDVDGWQVEKLNNKGLYGYLSTVSCNTAAFAEPNVICRNVQYILTKDKGFVAAGGSSNVSIGDVSFSLHYKMLLALADRNNNFNSYIELLNYAKSIMPDGHWENLTKLQYEYLGDPLLKLKITKQPDLYLIPSEIIPKNTSGNIILSENDSIAIISSLIYNLGLHTYAQSKIELLRTYNGKSDTFNFPFNDVCQSIPFSFSLPIFKMPGIHHIKIIIDPDSLLIDPVRKNNTYTFDLQIYSMGVYALDPLPFWNKNSIDPIFRFIDPQKINNKNYEFSIIDKSNNNIIQSKSDYHKYENYIEWKPIVNLIPDSNYWLLVDSYLDSLNKKSNTLIIPFHISSELPEEVNLKINKKSQLSWLSLNNTQIADTTNDESGIILNNQFIPFMISGARGEDAVNREAEIHFNNSIYINTPPDVLGFKVVIVSGTEPKVKFVREYNTDTGDPVNDSSCVRLVKFLRDSVADGDYLMFTLNGEAFKDPWGLSNILPTSMGSLDTLKSELKIFGSRYADSLKYLDSAATSGNHGCSFAFIGRRGAKPGEFPEAFNNTGDTALITGNIVYQASKGSVSSPLIGPAKKWENISFTYSVPDSSNLSIEIHGITKQNLDSVLMTVTNPAIIDLSSISSSIFPYIKPVINFSKNDFFLQSPILYSITSNFKPAPELAFSQNNSNFTDSTVLRGDSLFFILKIENLSLRSKAENFLVGTNIRSKSVSLANSDLPVSLLNQNDSLYLKGMILTENLTGLNDFYISVNDSLLNNELYNFNNIGKLSFSVYEDTIPPVITIKCDGRIINDGDYVSIQPNLEILINDNSRLPIDKSKIVLRINSVFKVLADSSFTSYGNNITLKAKINMKSDSLDFGDNYYTVNAEDASGNLTSIQLKVFVAKNGFIDSLFAYPNPIQTSTAFKFNYLAPDYSGEGSLDIFNLKGQKLRHFQFIPKIGNNMINWDGLDENGNSIPSGVYFYKVVINSDLYVDPVYQKIVIVH